MGDSVKEPVSRVDLPGLGHCIDCRFSARMGPGEADVLNCFRTENSHTAWFSLPPKWACGQWQSRQKALDRERARGKGV